MDKNRVIGKAGKMPWHIPQELALFKKHTMGKVLIMGRKTVESLDKTLVGRTIIKVSHSSNCKESFCCASLDEAIKKAFDISSENEVFIAGGASIYKQAINIADRLYISSINAEYNGDTFFPHFNEKEFELKNQMHIDSNPDFVFRLFEKPKA